MIIRTAPRLTKSITCNISRVTWYEGTAQLLSFDRVEIVFILALFHLLKPLTDEGREETRIPGENP